MLHHALAHRAGVQRLVRDTLVTSPEILIRAVMITDPKTAPVGRVGRVAHGVLTSESGDIAADHTYAMAEINGRFVIDGQFDTASVVLD